jgi:hypothetical protein
MYRRLRKLKKILLNEKPALVLPHKTRGKVADL